MLRNDKKIKGFKYVREHPDKWSYWEKLNPEIREAMRNSPIDFGIYPIWKLQVKYGVKFVLQKLNTRALELTVCGVPPLGIDNKWVVEP